MQTKKNPTKLILIFSVACLTLVLSCGKDNSAPKHSTWSHYAGSPDQSKYFDGSEITKENVNQLEVAWVYEADGGFNNFSPIVVDTVIDRKSTRLNSSHVK